MNWHTCLGILRWCVPVGWRQCSSWFTLFGLVSRWLPHSHSPHPYHSKKRGRFHSTLSSKETQIASDWTLSCVYPWTNDCHRGNGMKVLIFLNDLLSLKLEVGQLPSVEQGLSGAGENICCEGRTSKWGWVQIKHTGKVFQEMWKPSTEEKWLCAWELMDFLFCISSQDLLTCRL